MCRYVTSPHKPQNIPLSLSLHTHLRENTHFPSYYCEPSPRNEWNCSHWSTARNVGRHTERTKWERKVEVGESTTVITVVSDHSKVCLIQSSCCFHRENCNRWCNWTPLNILIWMWIYHFFSELSKLSNGVLQMWKHTEQNTPWFILFHLRRQL